MSFKKSLRLWLLLIAVAIILIYIFNQQQLQNIVTRLYRGETRHYADVSVMPWRAVVLIRAAKNQCSGTLIAPQWVATAAHCVADKNTPNGLAEPKTLFILWQNQDDSLSPRAEVIDIFLEPDYLRDYKRGIELQRRQLSRDWALLKINPPIPLKTFANPHIPNDTPPYRVYQAGYDSQGGGRLRQDKCRIFEHIPYDNGLLLRHNCLISGGDSGGPLFIRHNNQWRLIGINVAIKEEGNRVGGYAVSLHKLLRLMSTRRN